MHAVIAKGLRGGRVRLAICVAGIAVSTLLVLVLFAAYRSVVAGVSGFIGRPPMDLWIAPRGTDNLIRSSGTIPMETVERMRLVPGTARVDPLVRAFARVEANGHRLTLLLIGFSGPDALGAPTLASGRMPEAPNEVALDRAAAHRLGVDAGAFVFINGGRNSVVGITSHTNLLATQFVFADVSRMKGRASVDARAPSFAVVALSRGVAGAVVERRIRNRFPNLEVMSREAFQVNNVREIGSGFLPLLLLITVLGCVSASMLISFLVNAVVEEHRPELAVLLATGATPAAIAAGLTLHAARMLFAGITAGAIFAHLLSWVIDRTAPVIPLTYWNGDLLFVAALLSACGLLSSIIPVLRLKDVDPLEAFRS